MIGLYRGRSLMSRVIRWWSRGPHSHAAWIEPNGITFEAWHRGGVSANPSPGAVHTPGTVIDLYDFEIPLTGEERERLIVWFAHQVGRKYDFRGIGQFITRRSQCDGSSRLFCSEYVAAGCSAIGRPLFRRVEPWALSPSQIAWSPLLVARGYIVTGAHA